MLTTILNAIYREFLRSSLSRMCKHHIAGKSKMRHQGIAAYFLGALGIAVAISATLVKPPPRHLKATTYQIAGPPAIGPDAKLSMVTLAGRSPRGRRGAYTR